MDQVVKIDGAADAVAGIVTNNPYGTIVGEPKYADFIYKMCDAYIRMESDVLEKYHNMGGMIQSHLDETGSKTVTAALEKILEDMSEASYGRLQHLGVGSLRKAHNVYSMITKEQLEIAKSCGISLRNLLAMCQNDVSDAERLLILKDVTEGTLDQKEIKDKVKELHPPAEKQEKRGGARKKVEEPLEFMKRVQEEMDALLKDMKEGYRVHAAQALASEDQATKDEYTQLFSASADKIELLNKQWAANEKVTQALLEE